MKNFFTPQRLWAPGHRDLQLYLLPDLTRDRELAELVAACRDVLADYPATARPIPPQWLHVTIQPVNHRDGQPDERTRQTLITALAAAFAAVPAFTLLVGSPLSYSSGALADLHPDTQINALIEVSRRAIRDVCGPDTATHDTGPAHLTLAYATADQDSDPVARRLRRIRPSHAPMTVDAVHLVEVEQDPVECVYRWTPVARFPLAAAGQGDEERVA